MWSMARKSLDMPKPGEALPGRQPRCRFRTGISSTATRSSRPFPAGLETAIFGLGCFWGAERSSGKLPGVYTTAVGYAGGQTPNPTYEEVCSGRTGHTEAVLVVYDPKKIAYEQLLKTFWESHDPTQGMRQGNDVGTQYRSAIYSPTPEQKKRAEASREAYEQEARQGGLWARSPPRSPKRRRSITPRSITSNISRKNPAVIAASAAPASPVPSAWRPREVFWPTLHPPSPPRKRGSTGILDSRFRGNDEEDFRPHLCAT